jgi:hypothetical protein
MFYNMDGSGQNLSQSISDTKVVNKPRPWPVWAQPFKLAAKPEDKGLGDIITRMVGPVGGNAYKAWHLKAFGRPCGCAERQESLNLKYPLTSSHL